MAVQRYGVPDSSKISEKLRVYVTQQVEGVVTTVVGFIGEGSSKELTADWESPFADDSAGASMNKAGGAIQSSSQTDDNGGLTSVSTWNSQKAWSANSPMTMSLTIYFKAFHDANKEVNQAIVALERMASPELSASALGGRAPQVISIDVGRTVCYPNFVIESVSSELDAPKTEDGYYTTNTVTLSISARGVINRSKIK